MSYATLENKIEELIKLAKTWILSTENGTDFSYCFLYSTATEIVPIDTSNGVNFNNGFSSATKLVEIPITVTNKAKTMRKCFNGCTSLIVAPDMDTSGATDLYALFASASKITTIPRLDLSSCTSADYCLYNNTALTNVTFTGTINIAFAIRGCDNLSVESLVSALNALSNRTGQTALTLTIGSVNKAKLTDAQLKIASDKNWTVN